MTVETTVGHTPGPWTLAEKEGYINISADKDAFPVALVELSDPEVNEYDRLEEDWANAQLIGAAPDLLEALQELAAHCELNAGFQNLAKGPYHKDLLALAKQAIAKAEGHQ